MSVTNTTAFYDSLGTKEQRKIDFVIDKVEMNLFGDWFKKLTSSNEIWEFVVDFRGVLHRLLSFLIQKSLMDSPLNNCNTRFQEKD